jgi:hypothetical protein
MPYFEHEAAKSELKKLVPVGCQRGNGHGFRAKHLKSGAISFDILETAEVAHGETIGAITAAGQGPDRLTNPKKALTGTLFSDSPREEEKTHRRAPAC